MSEKTFSIVTCCNRIPTEDYYCLPSYIKSLQGHTPIVLDESFGGRWMGLGSKPKWLYKAISEKIINTHYILFTDCWDFVFTENPTELMRTYFNRFGAPLVFSSEKNCFPDDTKEDYDKLPHTSSYKYLNSGMIVGETEAMYELLKFMKPEEIVDDYRMENGQNFHTNDQFLYQQAFLQQPVQMQLDYNQLLCNTLHEVKPEELDFTSGKIKNIETGSYPLSMHMNGSGKTNGCREPILKHLNLL